MKCHLPKSQCTEFKLESARNMRKKLKLLCQAIGFAMISNLLPTSNAIAATTLQADIFPKVDITAEVSQRGDYETITLGHYDFILRRYDVVGLESRIHPRASASANLAAVNDLIFIAEPNGNIYTIRL